ncbi:MAG: glycine oxidase ThiO [Pirellulaceae bacterium]|nr:glycine oxidase ThiO [Pirellulaceae bacterium]
MTFRHTSADYTIVGAGVLGMSLAFYLAKQGKKVALLEKNEPGKEASWSGAGILPAARLDSAFDVMDKLRGYSHEQYPVWAKELEELTGIDVGYRQTGGIFLGRTPSEGAALKGEFLELQERRIEIEPLTWQELIKKEPLLGQAVSENDLSFAYFLPGMAQVRNPYFLRALSMACEKLGVEVITHCTVTDFHKEKERVLSIETTRGRLPVGQLCIAAGAWSGGLLKQLGVSNCIGPIRGQILLFHRKKAPFQTILCEGDHYLVSRDDGYVLVGSTLEDVGFDKSTTQEGRKVLLQFAQSLLPSLKEGDILKQWSGLRPHTLDAQPYLGKVFGFENVFSCSGHFRSGLHLAPACAAAIGELMSGNSSPFELAPFSPSRLGKLKI